MEKVLEDLLNQFVTSPFVDPDGMEVLNKKARELRTTAPHDSLTVFRALAMTSDKTRFAIDAEKLYFFAQASDLGWQLNEPKWHFDRRAAELYRGTGNLSIAGDQYERAAKSFTSEGLANKCATPLDWQMQYAMLREARVCFEGSGCGDAASRCFVEGMKLSRDHAPTIVGRAKGWLSYLFWCWGESPLRVAIWGSVWIILFALSYSATGMNTPSGVRYEFTKALYLSVVTFTTLGFGDLTPTTGLGRLFAAIEALSGIFFTGLFLVTFVKRFSR